MPGRQTPPRPRLGQLVDLPQPLDPPVLVEPSERLRVGRTQFQDARRHRQQHMEVERAGAAAPDQADRLRVVRLDPLAKLAGEEMAPGDRQTPLGWRLRRGQFEDVLLDAREIEAPWDDARATRPPGKAGDDLGRAADRQVMVKPVRCDRGGGRPARPSPARLRQRLQFGGQRLRQRRRFGRRRISVPGSTDLSQRSSTPAGLSVSSPARWT